MDKKYIIKHNLMEAHKQFMRLSEGYLARQLDEEGDDDSQGVGPDNAPAGDPGQEMGDMGGAMPPQEQTQDANMNAGEGQDIPNNEIPPAGDELEGQLPPMGDELEPEEDDDVLDVEDLTQAQEKLNKKQNMIGHDLGEVDDRIMALLTAVEKIKGSIDKNNQDITSLKAELEKRMPTQTEKLNMQSLKMYPFNVSPKDYWQDKEKEGVYQAVHDSSEPNLEKKYEITQQDVDDYNEREVEDSFDDELRQTMKDIFKGY
jgi:hypothetical protein